jgi:hypothetical protein
MDFHLGLPAYETAGQRLVQFKRGELQPETLDASVRLLLDPLEALTGVRATPEARRYLGSVWRPVLTYLDDLPLPYIRHLVGDAVEEARKGWWGQVAPAGRYPRQTIAARKLTIGTPDRLGYLPWRARGQSPRQAMQQDRLFVSYVVSWGCAIYRCDPTHAAAGAGRRFDNRNTHIRSQVLRRLATFGDQLSDDDLVAAARGALLPPRTP